jgi:predicted enzyme related to lactoylglutathione lyase
MLANRTILRLAYCVILACYFGHKRINRPGTKCSSRLTEVWRAYPLTPFAMLITPHFAPHSGVLARFGPFELGGQRGDHEPATTATNLAGTATTAHAEPGSGSSAIPCTVLGMAIARFQTIVIDCPDPLALATFYAELLDWKVEVASDWVDVRAEDGQCISFQEAAAYSRPTWPTQEVPQQMHLDVTVDDLDAAEAAVLNLGATKHEHQPGTTFRVFLDPAGHPFCLCAG